MSSPWLGHAPRRWQAEAFPLALDAMRRRSHKVIQATTGSGKSILAAEVIASIVNSPRADPGAAIIVTVPTAELTEQLARTIEARLPGKVGRYFTRAKQHPARVIVTCLPSLDSLLDDLALSNRPVIAWIADECHKGLDSKPRKASIERMKPATRLGFTATPWRTEDPIAGWEAPLLFSYRLVDAVRDKAVLWPTVIPWTGNDETCVDDALIQMLHATKPEGAGIISAEDIADAERYAAMLTEQWAPAVAMHSQIPRAEQLARVERLKAGEVRAIVHVKMLVEGVDYPWLRWLGARVQRTALGRVQECGRVLRTCPGKDSALIFDPLDAGIIEAFATPADLGELEEAAAREAARALGMPMEAMPRVMPLAKAVKEVDLWMREVMNAAMIAGLAPEQPKVGERRQRGAATPRQIEVLREIASAPGRSNKIRLLPDESTRKAAMALASTPDALSCGAASRLIAVISAASKVFRETAIKAGSGGRPDWRSAQRWSGAAPPIDFGAVKSITAIGGLT